MNADFVATAAQLACLLEASAPKPGNVSPGRHFHDARYEHFLASAAAIGPAMMRAGERPIGPTVLATVQATAHWAPSNTNLGIVLLFAPLARAAILSDHGSLQNRVAAVLSATTIADARDVYAAIRLVHAGGLGVVDDQDVADEPTATLREVMALAADRDSIAREYATGFAITFAIAVPTLARARADGLGWDGAVVETYLTLLARVPDTLIARKRGIEGARDVSRQAAAALDAGGVRTEGGRVQVEALDLALRDPANRTNPGTTADLTAAAVFVSLLQDGGLGGSQRRTAR
jgi:triphosphoribosyl-dephospho-CoA synthase